MKAARRAVVLGYERLGAVSALLDALERRGFQRFHVLVNRPELLPAIGERAGVVLERVAYPQIGESLWSALHERRLTEGCPVVCVQDRVLLAYVEAWDRLGAASGFHVPIRGIRAARVKPLARLRWNEAGVGATSWAVDSPNPLRQAAWAARADIEQSDDHRYFVKATCGSGSEGVVPAVGWREVESAIERVRKVLSESAFPVLQLEEGLELDPATDVLVEEALEGPEVTVDGVISGGRVEAAVQHKESRVIGRFIGDGLIVSPPDRGQASFAAPAGFEPSGALRSSEDEIIEFVTRGLTAIDLDEWTFHAEVVETSGGLRFVELNPRPAGGLLARTAQLRLGVDLIDATVGFHVGEVPAIDRTEVVTGQFPIYAPEAGAYSDIAGVERARRIPDVDRVQTAFVAGEPLRFRDPNKENYLAFVSIAASDHSRVRRAAARARSLLKPIPLVGG